jgi:predicted NAD/FAD-binding protein
LTKARVWQVQRAPSAGFRVRTSEGRELAFDQLIFACSGPSTLTLLQGVAGAERHRAALAGIEFLDASLALHTDPIYASLNSAYWSFFNCRIDGAFAEASMYLAPVLAINGNAGPGLWKSWTTHRTHKPAQILHEAGFRHMLPSVGTVVAQTALAALQGRNGIWIAGGYTLPYDAQETALLSAAAAAKGLGAGASRLATLGL